jgi:hypothetical protein
MNDCSDLPKGFDEKGASRNEVVQLGFRLSCSRKKVLLRIYGS